MTAIISKRGWLQLSLAVTLLASVALTFPAAIVSAQTPPQKIDVSKLNSRVEDVVIPVPSEIFAALDKMGGSPNWNRAIAPDSKTKPNKQPEIALLLGTVIANGFIAVQAKDASRVKDIGHQVLDFSKYLGVSEVVLSHCNSINEAADKGEWGQIRSEFDKAQTSVRAAMERLNSKDLSELISIGGWLRGTDALTFLVGNDYSADRAELLHQPELVQTFGRQLGTMDAKVKSNQMVIKVKDALNGIKPLIDSSTPDKQQVEKIHTTTADLLKVISPS